MIGQWSQVLTRFWISQDGAATLDWVVITTAVTALSVAMTTQVRSAVGELSETITTNTATINLSTAFEASGGQASSGGATGGGNNGNNGVGPSGNNGVGGGVGGGRTGNRGNANR